MRTQELIGVFWCLGLAACQGGGSGDDIAEASIAARTLPSDSEIIAMVYDNNYDKPSGFFVDERADTSRSYSLYHVKDLSVSYELCSDDYNEALTWETTDNNRRTVHGELVGSYENDRYFEFIRELNFIDSIGNIPNETSAGFARVFKCSYISRQGVDRNLRNGDAGTLNVADISQDTIRTFSEYMWTFTFFWPAKAKVIQTISSKYDNAYQHTLVLAIATDQGAEKCDLIEIVDWEFSVQLNSGEVTKRFRLIYDFEAELRDGVPRICQG